MLSLRQPQPSDLDAVFAAYARSVSLHAPWAYPPNDYGSYLAQAGRYFVYQSSTQEIVGTFNISGVVRGHFQSGYLAYEVFAPYQNQGLMTQGLQLLLAEAFQNLNLHRLEANIQPGNAASIRLVARAGFIKEGFSRQYLRVGGQDWKDHERWAILNPHWQA